jgi:hypothetical protein
MLTVFLRSVLRLLVTANVVPSSPILVELMMEAKRSSETSVLTRATRRHIQEYNILHSHRRTRATRRHIQEYDILHSHRRENLKSHIPRAVIQK